MRKIEAAMNEAILKCQDWEKDNTKVIYSPERKVSYVHLYGNHIATIGETFVEVFFTGNAKFPPRSSKQKQNSVLNPLLV